MDLLRDKEFLEYLGRLECYPQSPCFLRAFKNFETYVSGVWYVKGIEGYINFLFDESGQVGIICCDDDIWEFLNGEEEYKNLSDDIKIELKDYIYKAVGAIVNRENIGNYSQIKNES